MPTTTIKKAANGYSKQQAEADKLLHSLAETGRMISADERRFLKSIGRLSKTGYAGDSELRSLVHRAKTIQQMRAGAGLGGEFERAAEHRDSVAVANQDVQQRLDKLNNEIRVLQSEITAIRLQSSAAVAVVERMEVNRNQLRLQQFLPADIFDDYAAAIREIGDGLRREILDTESDLHECKLALECDTDIANGMHRSAPHSDRVRQVLDFAKSHGCVDSFVDSGKMVRTTINTDAWAKFVAKKRIELPELQERIAELTEQYNDAKSEADAILDFWLCSDPWTARPLMAVVLGV